MYSYMYMDGCLQLCTRSHMCSLQDKDHYASLVEPSCVGYSICSHTWMYICIKVSEIRLRYAYMYL